MSPNQDFWEGGCACGGVRYRMTRSPMFVHCCHCTWCQRQAGSAFALNALIETGFVELIHGEPESVAMPTASGAGKTCAMCPTCRVSLWCIFARGLDSLLFLRVGTLDDAGLWPPDIHIYTSTKQPWVKLSDQVPAVPEYYRMSEHWPSESRDRIRALKEGAARRE